MPPRRALFLVSLVLAGASTQVSSIAFAQDDARDATDEQQDSEDDEGPSEPPARISGRGAARSNANIEMPQLVHFEEANYPAAAQKAGLQGDVVLQLTINAKGEVTAADVVQPAGNGFDEAAQAAALKFLFKPARRKNKPIAVRISYKYSFTLIPPELTPRSSASEVGTVPEGSGEVLRLVRPARGFARQGLVAPQLLHFEEATYPHEAWKSGIQGDVLLRLKINAEGRVTTAQIVQPIGNGFDEAAQEAALKFKFRPAKRRRRAVPVTIDFKYSFHLAPVVLESEEEQEEVPDTGNLSGQVRMAETDAPLAGAQIVAKAADGKEYRASSDAEGRWEFNGLPIGKYQVHVSSAGFSAADETEEVTEGEATEVTYRLAPPAQGLEVTVEGVRPPREVTKRTIERREMDRMPGTGGDALRSLQSLPGVARPPALIGLLIVRGSAPEDTQTFVDGSNTPLIYHFFGLSSIVPTELLDRIDFYPGNFSVKYGRGMGGIVDVALRSPDTRCLGDYMRPGEATGCYHGMVEADVIDGRFLVQGPVFGSKNWSFAAAGRRSWIDVMFKPVLDKIGTQITQAPVYYDYQLIVDGKLGAGSKLSFRVFGFNDRIEALVKDPAAQDPAFGGDVRLNTNLVTAQLLYQGRLSRDVELTGMLSGGQGGFEFRYGYLFDLNSFPIQARTELGWTIGSGVKLNAGIDVLTVPYTIDANFPPTPAEGEADPGPSAGRPTPHQQKDDVAFRPGVYTELELQPSRRLRIVPGVRFDYSRDSGHADISPRVNARYDLVPGHAATAVSELQRRTTLKAGVGLFNQPPEFQATDSVYGTPGLYSNHAIHYALGVEQEFTEQIELSVEGYYKQLYGLVTQLPSLTDYNNEGSGYVIGAETLLKFKPGKRFFGWLAYTLSRSIRRNGSGAPEYLHPYDQTHNLTAVGSYRLGRGWEFGARFRLISGTLVTPVNPALPALFSADGGTYTPLPGPFYSERLPLFHQLDVRVDKRWQFKHWRLGAFLDLQNAYNNRAVEALAYSFNYAQKTYMYGLPVIPSIGLRGEF